MNTVQVTSGDNTTTYVLDNNINREELNIQALKLLNATNDENAFAYIYHNGQHISIICFDNLKFA